ncbi:tRNA (adenine(58)-N(1))-methyltransferase catalytic subunit TRMT61A [Dirofilaria immitis]|nr:tRNA (adenine(58)-N(1))-methyltransferase catalytic subunit TRMT61A [Dirofilaria immitis]
MSFKWPWQYEFPPFFTLQTTLETREKQLEAWSRLVVDYCQFHKIYTVDLADISNSELFINSTLNRKLSLDAIRIVFDYLENTRHIDWLDKGKNRCHIYWRRPEEWAILIYEWAVTFYGLDKDVLLKSLAVLVEQRRAQLLNIGTGTEGQGSGQQTCCKPYGFWFLSNKEIIEEGDTVIIYVNYGTSYAVEVKRGLILTMRYGALKHEYLIGKRYGSRVSATAGYVYVLRPNAEMWTRALLRRTQIIYTPDCALILMLLDVRPGSIVCECGTGSGSLSHALAMAIAPTGHLYTHDIEETRVKQVELEMMKHGLGKITTCVHRNVIEDGFSVENMCDAVFLDLPAPWIAIRYAKHALSQVHGGRIVSFSPCIEQIQRTCNALQYEGFVQISTVELVPRKLKKRHAQDNGIMVPKRPKLEDNTVVLKSEMQFMTEQNNHKSCTSALLPFPATQPTHTGYIISATLLPSMSS